MTFIDHYKVLNVEYSSNNKSIRKAYYKLCLQWHPDKNKSDIASETFKKIQASYEILSDETKRYQYDKEYSKHYNTDTKSNWYYNLINNIKIINKDSIKKLFNKFRKTINNKELLNYIDIIHKTYENVEIYKNYNNLEEYMEDAENGFGYEWRNPNFNERIWRI